jgi:hypothetical protein
MTGLSIIIKKIMKSGSAELQQYDTTVDANNNWTPSANIRNTIIYSLLIILIAATVNYIFINYVSGIMVLSTQALFY